MMFSSILGCCLGAAGILLAFYLYNLYQNQKEQNRILSEKNNRLKTEQHDFKQHLQLLFTLQQMNKHNESLEYLKDLVSDLKQGDIKVYSGLPVLDSLLHYKQALAAGEDIRLEVAVKAELSQLPLSSPALCRVIGNLLDNGIDYLKESSLKNRLLRLEIRETDSGYQITAANPVEAGFSLPGEIERVFEPGFSSKGQNRGLGLAIVSRLVRGTGGEIAARLDSSQKTITFTIQLPRNGRLYRASAGRSSKI